MNKQLSQYLVGAVLIFSITITQAQDDTASSYKAQCLICHGDKAQGNPQMNAPSLAGQHSSYLLRQLENFSNGLRGSAAKDVYGSQMRGFASLLDGEQKQAMAEYLSKLAPSAVVAKDLPSEQQLKKGERGYNSYCGSCHGSEAQGNELLNAPRLANLDTEYFLRQYNNYLKGVRGTQKLDKFGRQMAMMAKSVQDSDALKEIALYVQSLQ